MEEQMDVEDRIANLKAQHSGLETELQDEVTRPHPDQAIVSQLKKQKLRIKDELATLGG